ncbi:MAG: methylated-DNA--[protein]-cysteine S-methyltransferase [Candidatus Aminicenantes bacterium]|nr:methylated-DNA--[protein]-cysteine S-methyltransferase [Candidatus Aminicenantes bacterium]
MAPQRASYRSPIGMIEIVGTERGLSEVRFTGRTSGRTVRTPALLREAVSQIDEYFRGRRKGFRLKLDLEGTDFQKKVWKHLLRIPCGRTASYGEVAAAMGKPGAARAVGQANHRNPIAVIVPCHRVIGAGGRMVGYGGGLWRKEWLLNHERRRP